MEADTLEKLKKLEDREKVLIKLVSDLSKVRLYNSADVFKGPMVKDKELVHDVVIRARNVLSDIEKGSL